MTTIENLTQLESELTSLSKAYSGTMASVNLDEERQAVTKVLKFLKQKKNGISVFITSIFSKRTLNFYLKRKLRNLITIGLTLKI